MRTRILTAAVAARPIWSEPAALRAVRATLIVPGLFALCDVVIGNLQMATFAAFGGFATLVLAGFGGSRRDKLVAHLNLAAVGSVLIVIGTAVNTSTPVAAVVTVLVAFAVLFAGIVGPNAASGATAVLLAYILPAASPGTIGMIPDRLAGWWLASVTGTLAVLILAPRPAGDQLRASAGASADALADQLDAALSTTSRPDLGAVLDAKHALMDRFSSAPYRPTGLAVSDQALANLVESLEWCTTLVVDALRERSDLSAAPATDRQLIQAVAGVLHRTARFLERGDNEALVPELAALRSAAVSVEPPTWRSDDSRDDDTAHLSFHARLIAAAAQMAAANTLIAARRDRPVRLAAEESQWPGEANLENPPRHSAAFDNVRRVASGHASVRSVWFRNSARGAVALAAAVAVADLLNVQHGFWVVLGALSVLRTNAASTGAIALRALVGTSIGFFVGAGLILAIGSHTTALWAALPLAVLVAAYTPGTAPFVIGQAAFTVTIGVLYNILVPVGWKVGVVRIEDVALGAAVSLLAGVLFWPRGAGGIVADDLADTFHRGGIYLVQATSWALGVRPAVPDARMPTLRASVRLDDALRALSAEQGSKPVPKEQVWRLVSGALRVRLTAESLEQLPRADTQPDGARRALVEEAVGLAGLIDDLAQRLGHVPETVVQELAGIPIGDGRPAPTYRGYSLWVWLFLDHLRRQLTDLSEPATAVAARRARPWWR